MDPQLDTAQRRAELAQRLYNDIDNGLFKLREALASHQTQKRFAVGVIMKALQEIRRAALLEGPGLHQEWRNGKHSGTFSDLLRHKLAQEG